MKKTMLLAVAVAVGLAFNASAVEVKKTTEVKGGTATTTTEVKGNAGKATEKVTTTGTTTTTDTKVKGKNIKMEKETVSTPAGKAGMANVKVKKGAIKDMKIDWTYREENNNYVIEYTIQDKTNKALLKELNLTKVQANLIAPGSHKIVSTSPYTADDVRNNLRAVIIKDLSTAVKK